MRLIISFAALFLSIAFLQLSSGAIVPLDVLSGLALDFSNTEIGLLGSAHFVGFFIGCWWAPRLTGTIGHNRAFAAFAAAGAIGALAHPMLVHPAAWAGFRVMTGLCIAGCYTVVEAWLQAKLENRTRGRIMGVYRFVDLGASLAAQLMIGVLEPAAYASYNLLAILCCASLLPLTLSRVDAPEASVAPRLRPLAVIRLSPLAAAGVLVAGVTSPAFRTVGPIYGQEVGLRADQIGLFLAFAVLGGAMAQLPAGWLADRYDRRRVLIGLSVAAAIVSTSIGRWGGGSETVVFAASFVFGFVTFPVFSISAAHANDFAPPEMAVELSAGLMFLYGLGAIASPLIGAILVAEIGPGALFSMISVAHVALILFGLYRMRVRSAQRRTTYLYVPRTSYLIGRLLRRR